MKDFRDDLLELLIANVGEFIDIQPLVDKYCGEGNIFDNHDDTKIKCRLNINLHLRELKEMGWINMTSQGGLSTAHSFNHDIGKRQFILDHQVKVRMTTKGEIEYKKSKQIDEPRIYHDNSITVGRDLTGIASTGNVSGDLTNNADDKESKSINKKSLSVNRWVLILTAVGIAVAIILYLLSQGQKL